MNAVIDSIPAEGAGSLFSIRGKVALVTGACNGHGLTVARTYISAGARVYLTCPDRNCCLSAAHSLGASGLCFPLPMDLADEGPCHELARLFAHHEERLDILVNNTGSFCKRTPDQEAICWRERMVANSRSALTLTRALAPLLRQSAVPEDPSRVINLGTIEGASLASQDRAGAFAFCRESTLNLTRLLSSHLGGGQVTINAISPSEKPDHAGQDQPMSDNPTDIAGIAVFLASRAGTFLNGKVMPVHDGV